MSLLVLPTPMQFTSMTSVADVRGYAEITTTVWNAASESLGSFDKCCQIFPQQAVQGQEVSPRQLTSVEVIQPAIMWRVWRQSRGLPDVDPLLATFAVPQQLLLSQADRHLPAGRNRSPHSQQVPGRHLLPQPHRHSRGRAVARCCTAPSPEQIAAAEEKIVNRDEEPYADFAVLIPFGRRFKSQMALSKPSVHRDHQISTHGLRVSKFTVPSR